MVPASEIPVSSASPTASKGALWRFFFAPSRAVEIAAWVVLAAVIIGVRMYLWHLLPAYLWSKDSMRYAQAPLHWLETGIWENDPKRGPIYSLVIAFCVKLAGTFNAVAVFQHFLGGLAVFASALALRWMHGPRSLWPVIATALGFAVYGQVIHLEHLVRNDLLLMFLSVVAFVTWLLALKRESAAWLFPCGLTVAVLTITKNVFAPFPVIVLAGCAWQYRQKLGTAVRQGGVFVAGLALPFIATAIFKQMTVHNKPPEPQAGAMLFARVAQFTVLDGGIEPEMKALIRPDIEEYQKQAAKHPGKGADLDNNLILNRTAVPRLKAYFVEHGKTPADADRFCRQMAVEAIRAHPKEYAAQVWGDFVTIHMEKGNRLKVPTASDVKGACRSLTSERRSPILKAEETEHRLKPGFNDKHFHGYQRITGFAWPFSNNPILLTSIFVTLLPLFIKGELRLWWLGALAQWWFTILLLCTIGRPLSRYLMPVIPVVYWTLGSVLVLLWAWIGSRLEGRGGLTSPAASPTNSPLSTP